MMLDNEMGVTNNGVDTALRGLIEAVPYGVMIVRGQGVVEFANQRAADLTGERDGQLIGKKFPEEVLAAGTIVPLRQIMEQPRPWNKVLSWRNTLGASSDLETTLLPLEQGKRLGIVLQEMEHHGVLDRRSVQAEKLNALDNVVAGVAHELNNPLTVILGYSELLLERQLDSDIKSRLAIICEKAERCRRIVDNLLRFSRGKDAPRSRVHFSELLRDTIALCEYQLKSDEIDIDLELESQLPAVNVQRRELQGVILSLINNAHQALVKVDRHRRRLLVRAIMADGKLRVVFKDSGCGVPEDIQHRIFDPFFTTREVGEGLGLGLSVAYGVLLEHHGRVWLEESSNEGSTFVFELPLEN